MSRLARQDLGYTLGPVGQIGLGKTRTQAERFFVVLPLAAQLHSLQWSGRELQG